MKELKKTDYEKEIKRLEYLLKYYKFSKPERLKVEKLLEQTKKIKNEKFPDERGLNGKF